MARLDSNSDPVGEITEFDGTVYHFTGEWYEDTLPHSYRGASRNRYTVWFPVYRAGDGSMFVDGAQPRHTPPLDS